MDEPTREDILRVWSLENAVSATTRKSKPKTVIKVAEEFYGYISRTQATIHPIKTKERKKRD